ncbi:MAG: N-acetylneuraminate synthase family protein [Deltaproteobacteria bacterium]|nr:N-acetylneuraminate synthase family protein [Deltaproteobacteria bacterium]
MKDKTVQFGGKRIGQNQPIFVIAEAGLNHGGNMALAIRMIETAAESGADAIKFQAFRTKERFGENPDIHDLVKPTELNHEQFAVLARAAKSSGIEFFATAFDEESVDMLKMLDVPAVKIASCDICNERLLRKVASSDLPVIISRGTADAEEIEFALKFFRKHRTPHILLHCVSSYPLEEGSANLGAIHSLLSIYDIPVGYSDHTQGIKVPLFAVYAGAMVIEKHFTIDRGLRGIDWEISAEPAELKDLIRRIREAEKILGHGRLEAMPCEEEEISYRKSMRMQERS